MVDIVTRLGKGSPLTNAEVDANFTNLAEVSGVTGEPMGHEDRTTSTISFNASTRTFTIAPVASSFTVWCKGKKVVVSSAQTVTIPNTTGMYSIYFDSTGALAAKSGYFTFSDEAPTAYIYWNATTGTAPYFGDERHGVVLDWQTHEYLHRTRGAALASGFSASGYVLGGNGSSNSHAQITLEGGTFFDEDMKIIVTATNTPTAGTWEQDLVSPARIPVLYLSGTAWVIDSPTDYPLKQGTARPQYNAYSGGVWSTADVANNKYATSWILATNNLTYPVIAIIGQAESDLQSAAEAVDFTALQLPGFPSVEFRPLYKLIFQCADSCTNAVHASLVSITDIRSIAAAGTAASIVTDHGNLSGLSDDDHPQYLSVDTVRGSLTAAVKASFLPSQTSSAGKFLQTDGTATSWQALTSGNVTTALGFTPYNATNPSGYITGISSSDVTTALGFTPYNATNPSGYVTAAGARGAISVTGAGSYDSATGVINIVGGVTSFNTRTGAITLSSSDVTTALGFTPYNNSNPSGYITGITSTMVTTALGYTPYNSSNPNGYISGITSGMVTTALGFTPYNNSNPSGYITSSALSGYLTSASAASTYLPLSGGTLSGELRVNTIRDTAGGWVLGKYGTEVSLGSAGLVNEIRFNSSANAAFEYRGNAILHAGNYNSYSPTLTGTGASGTWSINVTGSAGSSSYATYIYSQDIRTLAPSSTSAYRMGFGFTSWANNNSAPYADYLALRSYSDASGGNDNLVMFNKSTIAMRVYQQTFGSASAYSSYADVLMSNNYNSYSPTLTGGGASGTWGINITGSANSSSTATNATNLYGAAGTIQSTTVGTSYSNAYQVREVAGGGSNTSSSYMPRLGWHWGGVVASSIGIEASGRIAVFNNPGTAYEALIASITYGNESSRAPIFYDSNDTNWYVDPNGNSRVAQLGVGSNNTSYTFYNNGTSYLNGAVIVDDVATFNVNGSSSVFITAAGTNAAFIKADGGDELYIGGNNTWQMRFSGANVLMDNGGYLLNGESIRAPLYYDSANTAYYVDPNGTSVLYYMNLQRGTGGAGVDGAVAIKIAGLSNYDSFELGTQSNYDGFLRSYGNNLHYYSGHWRTTGNVSSEDHQHFWYTSKQGSANWSTWKMQLDQNAALLVTGSMYSPIFYDYNDTGYYVDPNSTSRIRKTNLVASGSGWDDGLNLYSADGSNRWNLLVDQGASNWLRFAYNQSEKFYIRPDGAVIATSDIRAPIFYDQNNTGYYLDPNGTSNLNQVNLQSFLRRNTSAAGYLEGNYPASVDGNSSSCIYTIGGAYQPGTTSLGNMYGVGFTVGNGTANPGLGMTGWGFYVAGGGTSRVFLDGDSGIVISSGSARSPIFYDRDNTSYYSDPTGTSELNRIGTVRTNNFLYLDNNYGHSVVGVYSSYRYQGVFAMGDAYKLPANGETTGNLYGIAWSHPNAGGTAGNLNTHGALILENGTFLAALSGSIRCRDDMRAPIFYDQNDTGYYLNPNSITSLRTIGSWRSNSDSWDGEFSGKIQYHSNNWYFQYAGSALFRNSGGGNIFTIDQSGNAVASGNVTAYSDVRLKENIVTIDSALDKVLRLRGVYYNKIGNPERRVGVIAQETEPVLPEVVRSVSDTNPSTGETTELLAVDYGNITGLLIEAMKEQNQEVVDLRNRVAQLESLITKLIGD